MVKKFDKRNVKAIALSIDSVESHNGWVRDIDETQSTTLNYPILADADRKVSDLYDMIHPNANAAVLAGMRSQIKQSKPTKKFWQTNEFNPTQTIAVFAKLGLELL